MKGHLDIVAGDNACYDSPMSFALICLSFLTVLLGTLARKHRSTWQWKSLHDFGVWDFQGLPCLEAAFSILAGQPRGSRGYMVQGWTTVWNRVTRLRRRNELVLINLCLERDVLSVFFFECILCVSSLLRVPRKMTPYFKANHQLCSSKPSTMRVESKGSSLHNLESAIYAGRIPAHHQYSILTS